MVAEVLGVFAAAKWYTQPPPKPKPVTSVKLPDSTPKVIKDSVVQMAIDQEIHTHTRQKLIQQSICRELNPMQT